MPTPRKELDHLAALQFTFGGDAETEKVACLDVLKVARLPRPDQLHRFHELLCFMQAWPDSPRVLKRVEWILSRFDRRPDLRRYAAKLADTGIAGTSLTFTFFAPTARWLSDNYPGALSVDWKSFESEQTFARFLLFLGTYSESLASDSYCLEPSEWVEYFKGTEQTDADFLIDRFTRLTENAWLREVIYDQFGWQLVLNPGPRTPCRSRSKRHPSPVVYQRGPIPAHRPVILDELHNPCSPPRLVPPDEAQQLIDLGRSAMVTRQRDLDAFAYGNPHDVSLCDDQQGVQFVLIGMPSERRLMLEGLYGYLILKNGVPIGYGAIATLFQSAEIAYTIFDSFRGGASAWTFARVLSMVHAVFGCDAFTIEPYQLGYENDDALASGAWWFYQKLGFRPRRKRLVQLMHRELTRIQRRPEYRSPKSVLRQLSAENLFLFLHGPRWDIMGGLEQGELGLRIVKMMAGRFGRDRERGERELSGEIAKVLRVRDVETWPAGEQLAWRRWAPLLSLVSDLHTWSPEEKAAVVDVVRAKGGSREIDYVRKFDTHPRLRSAIRELCHTNGE